MKEVVAKLLDQARAECFSEGCKPATTVGYDELEKLVELVVQECIGIVENCPPWYGDYRDQIENAFRGHLVAKMKYHFGVAE